MALSFTLSGCFWWLLGALYGLILVGSAVCSLIFIAQFIGNHLALDVLKYVGAVEPNPLFHEVRHLLALCIGAV
jgi:hypothetical protein